MRATTYDPGVRFWQTHFTGHQMMDLYSGMAGTGLHLRRDPVIAEFVHHGMRFHARGVRFGPRRSGREAAHRAFPQLRPGGLEGWAAHASTDAECGAGQTVTREMSRIIREGIARFGGTLIFEGGAVCGSQIVDPRAPRQGDTDIEAQALFRPFAPLARGPRVPLGNGWPEFHRGGRPATPTKAHFLANWTWCRTLTNTEGNRTAPAGERSFLEYVDRLQKPGHGLRPIWDHFADVPAGVAMRVDRTVPFHAVQRLRAGIAHVLRRRGG